MNDARKIIYNCKKATFLIEKKQLKSLSLKEQMELKLHLAGCSVCRTFQKQSVLINKHFKSLFTSRLESSTKLDDRFKKELQAKIDDAMKK